jgi:hypothetical protein
VPQIESAAPAPEEFRHEAGAGGVTWPYQDGFLSSR